MPGAKHLLLFASPCQPRGEVLLFNWALKSTLRTFALPQAISCLAPSPDGSLVAFGLASGQVVVADAQGEGSCELSGHCRGVQALGFSADGERLVSAAGTTMYVWDRLALKRAS
jgi:WD40 repeat protein